MFIQIKQKKRCPSFVINLKIILKFYYGSLLFESRNQNHTPAVLYIVNIFLRSGIMDSKNDLTPLKCGSIEESYKFHG